MDLVYYVKTWLNNGTSIIIESYKSAEVNISTYMWQLERSGGCDADIFTCDLGF